MARPPMMHTPMITRPATASPRTNLLAPSMEPKKSASWATSLRRWRACGSPIKPALRSASIAICLPGIESRVKRAPTSAIRPAPLVITMKLIVTRIKNSARPTAKLPPTRNSPKASITLPAASGPVWPSIRITRVDATFSDSRSSVVNSSTEGNAEKSSGFSVSMLTISTMIARAMLKVNNRSRMKVGNGRIIIDRISTISTGPVMTFRSVVASQESGPKNSVMPFMRSVHPQVSGCAGRAGPCPAVRSGSPGSAAGRRLVR